jgi:Flp pilus assembly protein TadD
MDRYRNQRFVGFVLIALVLPLFLGCQKEQSQETGESTAIFSREAGFAGAESCRSCHERFYQLWAPSHHGLAMQPFTSDFVKQAITTVSQETIIDGSRFRVEVADGIGWIHETDEKGRKNKYLIEHVLGGKNVYYFLTPTEKGRLQVMPLAYDVDEQSWYNTTASMVRHFGGTAQDEAIDWRESPLTFNTSCYNCHVSQLSTYYDLKTDTYDTQWGEPGINCETCHGPCQEHVRVCTEAPDGEVPADLKVIKITQFDEQQTNDLCAPCHAKGRPLTTSFKPGERFFDHFGLVTLEDNDFYPDGRDLGENYTYTHWLMSPCAKDGSLDCVHCHTSSGRYRFKDENQNGACLPCHEERVQNATAHTHHLEGSEGNLCISCHMPKTEFARMVRSDHTMRPPAPAASIQFGSPNACSICHAEHDAQWADKWVRKWRKRDYQKPMLYLASLVDAGRKGDWSKLPEMLKYVKDPDHDEIFATTIIRLLEGCDSEKKWPALLSAVDAKSPLVRSAAAAALERYHTPAGLESLLQASRDEFRVVRLRAAMALASYPEQLLTPEYLQKVQNAFDEYEGSLKTRPDQWSSHYNLGNFYYNRGRVQMAISSFETATKLDPTTIAPLVNASFAYSVLGDNSKAEIYLRKAIDIEPQDATANFNLGLLLAEKGDIDDAEMALRTAFASDSTAAAAAYNLGILLAGKDIAQSVYYCKKAWQLHPDEPRYVYTYAFYLNQAGKRQEAIVLLENEVESGSAVADVYLFLGALYEENSEKESANRLYNSALQNRQLGEQDRYRIAARLQMLNQTQNDN